MIVVVLNAGDVVTLRNHVRTDDSILGGLWSKISGFLLYESDASEVTVG